MSSLKTESESKEPLSVERIRVRPDRIETTIRVGSEKYAYTNKNLID